MYVWNFNRNFPKSIHSECNHIQRIVLIIAIGHYHANIYTTDKSTDNCHNIEVQYTMIVHSVMYTCNISLVYNNNNMMCGNSDLFQVDTYDSFSSMHELHLSLYTALKASYHKHIV